MASYPLFKALEEGNADRKQIEALLLNGDDDGDSSGSGTSILIATDDLGHVPLHLACAHGHSLDVVKLLTDWCPDGVRVANCIGLLPLHYACHAGASLPVVEHLIRLYPDGLKPPARRSHENRDTDVDDGSDDAGQSIIPLDYAFLCNAPLSVVGLLLDWYPEGALLEREGAGGQQRRRCPPLFSALNQNDGRALEVASFVTTRFPNMIRSVDHRGAPFLHRAVQWCDNARAIDFLIRRCGGPEALQEPDPNGRLPLHYATMMIDCASKAPSLRVLRLLIDRYPMALSTKDSRGRLPLHCAIVGGRCTVAAIDLLVRQYPEGRLTPDYEGSLPISHLIQKYDTCSEKAFLRLFNILVDDDARCLAIKNGRGHLPIHVACMMNHGSGGGDDCRRRVVQLLGERYGMGLQAKDEVGRQPLHVACASSDAPLTVVEYLIGQFPAALQTQDDHGLFPLLVACTHDGSMDVIRLLVEHSLELFERTRNNNNKKQETAEQRGL